MNPNDRNFLHDMNKKRLQLGMIGCGVVGTAVANLISDTSLNNFNEIFDLKSIPSSSN